MNGVVYRIWAVVHGVIVYRKQGCCAWGAFYLLAKPWFFCCFKNTLKSFARIPNPSAMHLITLMQNVGPGIINRAHADNHGFCLVFDSNTSTIHHLMSVFGESLGDQNVDHHSSSSCSTLNQFQYNNTADAFVTGLGVSTDNQFCFVLFDLILYVPSTIFQL